MATLRFESRGQLRAPPEALWPFLADTPKLNRAIGLPPIHYTIRPAEGGGSHIEAEIRVAGRTLSSWSERPFRWHEPYGYVVLREFHDGPLASVRGGVELTRAQSATALLVFADFVPRNALGTVLLRAGLGRRATDQIVAQCRVFDRHIRGQLRDPFPQLVPSGPRTGRARGLEERLIAGGADRATVERLVGHLVRARDDEVVKMRPFELADRWRQDRRATLALFLRATTVGLLTMSWDVLCPNCRVGQAEYAALRDLRLRAHCESCNIIFDASFDRLVEVRFSVAPGVRKVTDREYCVGGPMNTPHVAVQIPLAPDERHDLACRLGTGAYRVRSSQAGEDGYLHVVEDAPVTDLRLRVTAEGVEPRRATIAPGEVAIAVENRTPHDALLAIEGQDWPDTVATAATVGTLQEFRDLFSSEVLAPGLQLGIRSLVFLFTDLVGSTALYQRVGQARAFRIVQDHFEILGRTIAAHRGALVKTIGDAVMATFETGTDALAAAVAIQRDIRALDVGREVDATRLVRVGLHQGPCVAVTLNDRLDYFGTAVNIASRVEHHAVGGEIVATEGLCESAEARAVLAGARATLEPDVVRLRGIREPLRVYRVTVP